MTEHTALPLSLKEHDSGYELISKDGKNIMSLTGFRYPSPKQLDRFITTARLIVTACNCHAELLMTVKTLTEYILTRWDDNYGEKLEHLRMGEQAIRHAEEQEGKKRV